MGYKLSYFVKGDSFPTQVLGATATNLAIAGLGLLTGTMVARLLGPEKRGELAAIQMWALFIGTIALLGIPDALLYFVAKNPKYSRNLLISAIVLGGLVIIPFMILGHYLLPYLLSAQPEHVISEAKIYLLILLPLSLLERMTQQALRGTKNFSTWNILRLLPTVGWLVVLILAWTLKRFEAPFVARAYLGLLFILNPYIVWVGFRKLQGRLTFDHVIWKKYLRFGLPSVLTSVPSILNYRLDQMLMATFLSLELLGFYVVAVSWSSILGPFVNGLGMILFPRVASSDDPNKKAQLLIMGSQMTILIATIGLIPIAILTPFAIRLLFGEEYTPATNAAVILVFAAAFAALKAVLGEGMRGLGKPEIFMISEFIGLCVTVVSLLIFLRNIGIVGAAISSLLGYSASCIFSLSQMQRLTGYSLSNFIFPKLITIQNVWRLLFSKSG